MGRKLMESDFDRIQYFSAGEFGAWWNLEADLVFRADAMRHRLGVPLIVTSAWRDIAGNQAAGGADNSQHLEGRALDLQPRGANMYSAYLAAESSDFSGIGVYDSHIHVDTRAISTARWAEKAGQALTVAAYFRAEGFRQTPLMPGDQSVFQAAGLAQIDPRLAAAAAAIGLGLLLWKQTDD